MGGEHSHITDTHISSQGHARFQYVRTFKSIRTELLRDHGHVRRGVVFQVEGGVGGVGIQDGDGGGHLV